MILDILTYDCQHRKTVDILIELIVNDYSIRQVIAAPLIDLGLRKDIIKISANNCYTIHTKDICKKFQIPYVVKPHMEIENGDIGIIGGARILPKQIIDKFDTGIINIHPGLLPENRGLDNIKWALYHNISQGLTVHFIDQYIDRGHIILREKIPVFEDDKIYHIHQRLVSKQPKVLVESLKLLENNKDTYPAERGNLFSQMSEKEEIMWLEKHKGLI